MLKEYYDAKTKTLTLPHYFNKVLNNLPVDIEEIIFREDFAAIQFSEFDQKINLLLLTYLTHLTFGAEFNKDVDNLPLNLTHLVFGHSFNKSVCNLPKKLIYLIFGHDFNQVVDILPSTLTHLTFGACFNQSVNYLPSTLTHLTFGHWFNQIVDNLPQTLIHLTLGHSFDQKVDNLPKNLIHLTFGNGFNQSVDNLPTNLIHLIFGWDFNQSVDFLPKTLIELGFCSHCKIKNKIPENIINIKIIFDIIDKYNETIDNLPCNVKLIKIDNIKNVHYLKKIPFGCKVMNEQGEEFFL